MSDQEPAIRSGLTPTLHDLANNPPAVKPAADAWLVRHLIHAKKTATIINRAHRLYNRKPKAVGTDKFATSCARKWEKQYTHGGKIIELVRTFHDRYHKQFGDPSAMGD